VVYHEVYHSEAYTLGTGRGFRKKPLGFNWIN